MPTRSISCWPALYARKRAVGKSKMDALGHCMRLAGIFDPPADLPSLPLRAVGLVA